MTEAIFTPDGDRFRPSPAAGSPWADGLMHGGPPAALLARAIERHVADPAMHVSRLTIDLFRPVPMTPLQVTARSVRAGKRIHAVEASLLAGGVEVCRASGLLLRRTESPGAGRLSSAPPLDFPTDLTTTSLAGGKQPAGDQPRRPGFHTTAEARWVSRPDANGGTAAVWLRIPVPVIAGEETTPLMRVAALCDFVNAVGSFRRPDIAPFINTDSTIYLHRPPAGEWIGIEVERAVEPGGVGVAASRISDAGGPIGRSMQALLANQYG